MPSCLQLIPLAATLFLGRQPLYQVPSPHPPNRQTQVSNLLRRNDSLRVVAILSYAFGHTIHKTKSGKQNTLLRATPTGSGMWRGKTTSVCTRATSLLHLKYVLHETDAIALTTAHPQDKTVIIHVHDAHTNTWSSTTLDPQSTGSPQGSKFADTVWRVSWSVSGAVLAVSCGDGKISLWKENLKGAFEMGECRAAQ